MRRTPLRRKAKPRHNGKALISRDPGWVFPHRPHDHLLKRTAASAQKIRIRLLQPLVKRCAGVPPESSQLRNLEELARRPIRARSVEYDFSLISHDIGDQPGKFGDSGVLPGAHVDVRL